MDSNNDNKPVDQSAENSEQTPVQSAPQPVVDVVKTETAEVQAAPPQDDMPQLAAEPAEPETTPQQQPDTSEATPPATNLGEEAKKDAKKEENPLAITKQPDLNKRSGPIAAIVSAIVIAVALIALTIFAYMKTNNTGESTTDSTTSTQQEETVQPATAEDVDATTQEIDETLNTMDASQDFPDDINDESLGL